MHKVHTPPLDRPGGDGGGPAVQRHVLAAPDPHPDLQPVESIEPSHPLTIHRPSLPAQPHPDAQVPKARPRVGQLPDPEPECGLIARSTPPIPRRATELGQPAGPRAADREPHLKPSGQLPTAHGPWGVFSQRPRQHVFVEREIGDQALQPRVLVLQLPEAPDLAHAQVGVLLLPRVERGFADPQLPADVRDRRARLDLAQRIGDLLLGESRAMGPPPVCGGPLKPLPYSSFRLPSLSGDVSRVQQDTASGRTGCRLEDGRGRVLRVLRRSARISIGAVDEEPPGTTQRTSPIPCDR